MEITTSCLAKEVEGVLIGPEKPIKGIFTFLNQAKAGDVVIRHWIDPKGVEIAVKIGISCLITQTPKGNATEIAEKHDLPIIVTNRIELANAFAIKWAVKTFAENSLRVVVTGTNGKSTTAHMIHNIIDAAGYNTYTNTDAKSEFNTLIDPVIAKQIAEFQDVTGGKIQSMVIEVSEVQGWLDKIMKDHAQLMTSAVNPQIIVLTNVSLDHIGLVNNIEETFNEIYGSVKAVLSRSNSSNKVHVILNSDDPQLMKMGELIGEYKSIELMFYGTYLNENHDPDLKLESDGIYYQDKPFLKADQLPFQSVHFLQNTMAAIGVGLVLGVDPEIIKNTISSYKPLDRRFSILSTEPLIIDDFAHNPEGIIATINSAAKTTQGILYIVYAIRGSRGEPINQLNTEAVVKGLEGVDYILTVTSSADVVNDANEVTPEEKNLVFETLQRLGLNYCFREDLHSSLIGILNSADKNDTILLIGAQGMDPAKDILKNLLN